jgi:phage baseplate assembly protein W
MTDYPHFALPFQWGIADGGGVAAIEVEQESLDEIGGCVEAILRTTVGQRTTLPDFGRPELEFNTSPEVVRAQLADALLEFEPRVEALITAAPSDDDAEIQIIRALISPADEEGEP